MDIAKTRRAQNSSTFGYLAKAAFYTFILFLVQARWVSGFSHPAMRIDLLLPLMFGVALKQSPVTSLSWAFAWGYVMDVFSGKFWGFHVVSYVVTVCMVYLGSQRLEFHNPLYQTVFMGLCALGQSVVLGLFLWAEPSSNYIWSAPLWASLGARSLLMLLLCPIIIYPIRAGRKFVF
ncbi:MAG: rod shape-determining protein MreD [Syntrophobacteraceae bacterium]